MGIFVRPAPRTITDAVIEAWQTNATPMHPFTNAGALTRIPDDVAVVSSFNLDDMELVAHPTGCGCFGCNLRDDPDEGAGIAPALSNSNLPLGTLQEMADYLRVGYWQDTNWYSFNWNVSGSGPNANPGELLYNLSGFDLSATYFNRADANGISAARKDLVRDSFDIFEEVLGIKFTETTSQDSSTVDFFFSDNDSGAYASTWINTSSGTSSVSFVNVNSGWSGGTSTYDDYTLQTILHEIGHALGLGHQGNYNGSASFPGSATFANDSWQASMMSYFSQSENGNISANYEFLQTPMAVDWIALQDIYGEQSHNGVTFGVQNAFLGDTIYGFNTNISSNVSSVWAQFSNYANRTASTIVDGGGTDVLDFSGYGQNQRINLESTSLESYDPVTSDIGGRLGNLTIAHGTIIEDAISGSGNDELLGNGSPNRLQANSGADYLFGGGGNDTLSGGIGSDTLEGGAGSDVFILYPGDTEDFILDFQSNGSGSQGDKIDVGSLDISWGDVEITQFGNDIRVDILNQSVVLKNVDSPIVRSDFIGLSQDQNSATVTDFNGDGRDDILWYHISGMAGYWQVNSASTQWTNLGIREDAAEIVATGDYTMDGVNDILWMDSNRHLTFWDPLNVSSTLNSIATLPNGWKVVGSGNFDGGMGSDILLRHENGMVGYWSLSDSGILWTKLGHPDQSWNVEGVADFNSDGVSEVLWRHDNGHVATWDISGGNIAFTSYGKPSQSWQIVGSEDYNGDGVDDILWYHTSGQIGYWDVSAGAPQWSKVAQPGSTWEVVGSGDYLGLGYDQILGRATTGEIGYWDVGEGATQWRSLGEPSTSWSVIGESTYDWML